MPTTVTAFMSGSYYEVWANFGGASHAGMYIADADIGRTGNSYMDADQGVPGYKKRRMWAQGQRRPGNGIICISGREKNK